MGRGIAASARVVGPDVKLSVFSDLACAWCYVGATRLERAVAAYTLQTGEQVDTAFRAYQRDSMLPSDTDVQAVEAGRSIGLDFDLANAVQADTFDGHRLLAWAEATGGLGAQRDLAHELWRAHFAEGADIADHDTLAARAAACRLDADAADDWLASSGGADEVRMQIETAQSAGITVVPTVVVEGQYALRGTQSQDTYLQALREVAEKLRTG